MQLFYAPDMIPPLHTLGEEESRHAVKVLRLGVGSRLHLTDGRGAMYVAEVCDADPRGCVVRVVETFPDHGRRNYRLAMAVAPTKNLDRYEWFLEKATEIGVDVVVPILCANSERRVFKPDRAQKILVGAMKQSLKARLPLLEPLTPVGEVLTRPRKGVGLIAHCRTEITHCRPCDGAADHAIVPGIPMVDALPSVPRASIESALPSATDALVLIGPEGDFTAEEVALALRNNFTPVSLGESRLRTETAALVAVTAAYLKNI